MCIVIAGETQPDTTKLINIPVKIYNDSNKYNLFIYINNFVLDNNNIFDKNQNIFDSNQNMPYDSLLGNQHSYGSYASFQEINNFDRNINGNTNRNTKKGNSIMVVPFPVEKNTKIDNIGLVDISTKSMKEMITNIKDLKPIKKSRNFGKDTLSYNGSFECAPLEVHKIGNYNISVATSLNELLNRIDWNKFKKPTDYNKRINTFNNSNLYPTNYDYFYVVAEAVENIKDDGFGIVYPQLNEHCYIPTAHEDTDQQADFDVEIYSFSYNNNIQNVQNNYKKILKNINGQNVKMLNNIYKSMYYDDNINSFRFIEEKERKRNHNTWL